MINNKWAMITGASRGIGAETIEIFAKHGYNIFACARKTDDKYEDRLQTMSKRYGVNVVPIYFDLDDQQSIKVAISQIKKEYSTPDILVNIAGVAAKSSSFLMTSCEKVENVLRTNFIGQTILTQYVVRLMIRNGGGSIVNVSSVAAIDGEPAQYEYAASKAAVIGGTRELARELAPYSIRVNAVAPGIVDTDMGYQIDAELRMRIIDNRVMMKRMAKPSEIVEAILFLASDKASYITGQVLRVDGGM